MNFLRISLLSFAFLLALVLNAAVIGQQQVKVQTAPATESKHPPAITLWPNGAPGSESRKGEPEKLDWRGEAENGIVFPILFNIHNPTIIPFLPKKGKGNGAAVIVAPGGGNMFLTIDREGYDLAKWLAERGVAAFVLKYRLSRDKAGDSPYKPEDALADGARAVRMVRSRADEWGIDSNRIGFLGFSAGGAVAGQLAVKNDSGNPAASDPVEKVSSRPDFNGFVYGGPYQATDFSKNFAPSFLLCTYDDKGNVNQLADLFVKLKAANVPAELHIYGSGGHGFGVRTDRNIAVETWPARFLEWMKDIGMLKTKK